MPVINDGDTVTLAAHKVARVAVDPDLGTLTNPRWRLGTQTPTPGAGRSNLPVLSGSSQIFTLEDSVDSQEKVATPTGLLGSGGVTVMADGDPDEGNEPLSLGFTVQV